MSLYARVAVPRPLQQTFLYRVPEELADEVTPGSRVVVPFGRRQLTGWIDELADEPDTLPAKLREILDAPDPEPVLDPDLLDLCRWIARYYIAPIGLTYRAALPARLTAESSDRLSRGAIQAEASELSSSERTLLDYLDRHKGSVKLSTVSKSLGAGPWARSARKLAERGLLRVEHETPTLSPPVRTRQIVVLTRRLPSLREREALLGRAPRQRELYEYLETAGERAEVAHIAQHLGISRSVVQALVNKGVARIQTEEAKLDLRGAPLFPEPSAHTPTPAQSAVIRHVLAAAGRRPPPVLVLKGVTGSGKTLVYIEVLRELVQRRGQGAILLVPEISLTPQTLSRFRAAFATDVALLHSALSDGERFSEWQALRRGEKRIVIGARSAVFAPVRNLGAIIIDEEHESTYKQSDPAPRYHAREVAVVRAQRANALCLLGSATPSLEAWARAAAGDWQLLELPERIGQRSLPGVAVVDLRVEPKPSDVASGDHRATPLVLSNHLRGALATRLQRREQAILLLNRRGYSNFVQCRSCGVVRSCFQCNVSLTQHRRPQRLVCHYCNHQEPIAEVCPECGSAELYRRGVGTEQVERVLGDEFPAARIARMDVDTTSGKWSHHEILARVGSGEVDILLGTQMIAKGLDFPNVTLVGVINADVGLNLPDFRASERTFQLLTQVAGRAGRGSVEGEVIVQTSLPRHYAIRFALNHDYDGFAARELEERREPEYPPHTRLANLIFSGKDEIHVQEAAEAACQWLAGLLQARSLEAVSLLGPAPCPIDRIRGRWRWHLVLKSRDRVSLGRVLRYFARKTAAPGHDVRVEIDRDPISLL